MKVTKGLVIDDPWLGHILSGEKTWEMRSTAASFRGWFGLIRKGSGAVHGVANLKDVGRPLLPDEMVASFDKHRIPESMIRSGAVAKWNTPWILSDVHRLKTPVRYRHPSGAVTWVRLDPAVTQQIGAQLESTAQVAEVAADEIDETPSPTPTRTPGEPLLAVRTVKPDFAEGRPTSGMWGESELTEGNIKNSHFYMRSFLHRFPTDLIGGSNKTQAAPRSALVDWGGPAPVETDIDSDKQLFRARGWVRQFFAENDAQAGDVVRVEETAPYRYRVSLRKR